MNFQDLPLYPRTLGGLGFRSLVRVGAYRAACRSGMYRTLMPMRIWRECGEFFHPAHGQPAPGIPRASAMTLLERAEALLDGRMTYYSGSSKKIGSPPDWFLDPFSGGRFPCGGHWSDLDEYSQGDIKNVWEASRFEWVSLLARAWRIGGDDRFLKALNDWVSDWIRRNPENTGPNWKCGQEASIRVLNLMLGARLLDLHRRPSPSLARLLALHCRRIRATNIYAIAQNNNHCVSEAAALYIGGSWLSAVDVDSGERHAARAWREKGRRLLIERVAALVAEDGSFSQHSVNYQRVLLDTLCQVEVWRRNFNDTSFGEAYRARCRAAVDWLTELTDFETGNAPNLGANDGARLYDLAAGVYRDFRPSIQLASVLFHGMRRYGPGAWDVPLSWLGLDPSPETLPRRAGSLMHADGGDLVLRSGGSHAVIRFARFRFRPGHADCLHFDLWSKGRNILRDGGSFSYNAASPWSEYFSGTASHNTVQFDGRDQMPRLGRFQFGEWLEMKECTGIRRTGDEISWTGSYADWKNAFHRRTVRVQGDAWRITDEVEGFRERALLRWRLMPADWKLDGAVCEGAPALLRISATAPWKSIHLAKGWESLHYQEMSELPVLEVEVGPGRRTITTEIILKD